MSAPVMPEALIATTRTMSPGEQLAVLLTGACVLGEKSALKRSEGREMEPYPGAETMAAVVNVCLSMVEEWGYIEDGGATPEAWDFVLWERLESIPEGQDCAAYCREYYQDWQASEQGQEVGL